MEHILSKEEKKKLSYEFSFEFLQTIIKELQKNNYNIYKRLIFCHKLVIVKYNSNNIEDFNKKVVNELMELEIKFLKFQNILDLFIKLFKSNIEQTNIKLKFKDEISKKNFFDNLEVREKCLDDYQTNVKIIENYITNFSNKLQKIYSSNIFQNNN